MYYDNKYLAERYGYRRVMIGALIWITAFVFPLFFAHNLPTILVGEFLCGVVSLLMMLSIR